MEMNLFIILVVLAGGVILIDGKGILTQFTNSKILHVVWVLTVVVAVTSLLYRGITL